MAAWANAANSAMLAEAFRIAGRTDLMASYRDAAVTAYNHANGLADPMLDVAMPSAGRATLLDGDWAGTQTVPLQQFSVRNASSAFMRSKLAA